LWPIDLSTANRWINKVMAEAGIHGKQATIKALRHGFAVAQVLAGKITLPELQKLLGHASLETTAIYLQVHTDDQASRVNAAWGKG